MGLEQPGNIYTGIEQTFFIFIFFHLMVKNLMTFQSLPYEPRTIEATEKNLELIYDAARKGLKGDALAYAAGMTPLEYRRLIQLDPIAEYAEYKGRAEGEAEMAAVLRTAALAGDTKAALEVLKHAHGWVAKQAVSVEVNQTISITAALQEAQQRVIEGALLDGSYESIQHETDAGRGKELLSVGEG